MTSSPELEELYFKYGNIPYAIGEDVSQLQHGLQAGEAAQEMGYDRDFVLACLLHDIGHMIGERDGLRTMGDLGAWNHEGVGADWLVAHGFTEYTADLVRHHTTAKRYMATVDPEYEKRLSVASKNTLRIQGGRMTPQEQKAFENHPNFYHFIRIRTFDDGAKRPEPDHDEERLKVRWRRFFQ